MPFRYNNLNKRLIRTCRRIACYLTSRGQRVYTRVLLHSNFILSPAQESSKVRLGLRDILGHAARPVHGDVRGEDVRQLGVAGVELPRKVNAGRVGLELARDLGRLVARRAQYLDLPGTANWSN